MSDRPPVSTTHRDRLEVVVTPDDAWAPGPFPSDVHDEVWACVRRFVDLDAVLVGGVDGSAGHPARLLADAFAAQRDAPHRPVVVVGRGAPSSFTAAARAGSRLRLVLVDDAPAGADLSAWEGALDAHSIVVTRRSEVVGAVCEALVHEGPSLVHVAVDPRGSRSG